MFMKTLSVYFLLFVLGFSAWARPSLELTQTVTVNEQGDEAKHEAFKKAIESVSLKLIGETIGKDSIEKNTAKMKQILAHSEKYILFIKGSNPEPVPDGSRVQVEMKVSLDNLEE